jgi:hypothetical protein
LDIYIPLYLCLYIIIPKKYRKVNLEQFGEKIAMGDRISKLGAGREQRQIAPGISSWGWDIQYLISR